MIFAAGIQLLLVDVLNVEIKLTYRVNTTWGAWNTPHYQLTTTIQYYKIIDKHRLLHHTNLSNRRLLWLRAAA